MSAAAGAQAAGAPPAPLERHAVVTGANRGLGLEIARRLVQQGFRVAAVCRRLEDATRTARELNAMDACRPASCCQCVPIQLDLAEGEAAVRQAAAQVVGWLEGASKGLTLLVNNAGNSYGSWGGEAWADSRAVNFKGPCLLTEALLPAFIAASDGSPAVAMVGSGLGEVGLLSPKFQQLLGNARSVRCLDQIAGRPLAQLCCDQSWVGPYGLSKALLHRATALYAADSRFASRGIRVYATCPGWVSTDMGGEEAPISTQEGAGHILEKALSADATPHHGGDATTESGTFNCYCYKNYDDEHNRAWEEKHGKGT
jgi:NAD(P)-dependent dehydrogenase (short-subunit alcohol dehydrogenase family)